MEYIIVSNKHLCKFYEIFLIFLSIGLFRQSCGEGIQDSGLLVADFRQIAGKTFEIRAKLHDSLLVGIDFGLALIRFELKCRCGN